MKKAFVLVLVLMAIVCCSHAQKPPSLRIKHPNEFTYYDTFPGVPKFSVSMDDTSIRIGGDTLSLIRFLMNKMERYDSFYLVQRELVAAGVLFLNHVPDVWKSAESNPFWPPYWELLQKQGYSMEPVKRKSPLKSK